jgi:hypothetical protein
MHATTALSGHGWRTTRFSAPRLCPAPRTRQHGSGIALTHLKAEMLLNHATLKHSYAAYDAELARASSL